MKFCSIFRCSHFAVGILILIQISATVCYIEAIDDKIVTIGDVSVLPENVFENTSTNIFALHIKDTTAVTIPENIFGNLTNLMRMIFWGNAFEQLPENIFENQTKLATLDLSGNNLTSLPENIFQNQINLISLNLESNKLTTFPRNLFKSQVNLQTLSLGMNSLTTLPDGLFHSQTKLNFLELRKNNLSTLSEFQLKDIFKNSNLKDLQLTDNPWLCDCDFLEEIQPYFGQIQFGHLLCADGELVVNKLTHSVISPIVEKSMQPNSKFVNRICGSKVCPTECRCLTTDDRSSVYFDCSNGNLTTIPRELDNIIDYLPSARKYELNIDNNQITELINTEYRIFFDITKISARNNSIEKISIGNIPLELKEIDLRDNKMIDLGNTMVMANEIKRMRKMLLNGNPWTCEQDFIGLVRYNREKVDYEEIVCGDGERLYQKSDYQTFWITYEMQDDAKPLWADANVPIHKLDHDEELGRICPTECNCFISQQNTTISYECSSVSFTRILNQFDSEKFVWPFLKDRRLIL